MRVSEVVETIMEAIHEKVGSDHESYAFTRGMLSQLVRLFGDLEIDIKIIKPARRGGSDGEKTSTQETP
jgi:hypothetical protein